MVCGDGLLVGRLPARACWYDDAGAGAAGTTAQVAGCGYDGAGCGLLVGRNAGAGGRLPVPSSTLTP